MGPAQLAVLGLAALSVGLGAWAMRRDTPPVWRFAAPAPVPAGGAPRFETVLDYTPGRGQAHSPGIVVESDGFSVLWFEGSEEAQADVDIHHARFVRDGGAWMVADNGPRLTRGGLGAVMEPRQIVVTLGNTIENEGETNALYATVASVGGWAMASVADVRLAADGPTRARKLNLSPILNRSHLVKSPMVAYADGPPALPAYFEMGAMHGLLVRFDPRGRVRDTRRIDGAGQPIQPMIVALSETRGVAFLRDFGDSRRLLVSRTQDGGQSWSRVEMTEIENPSSPVAALGLGGDSMLLAVNDDGDRPEVLRLVLSDDAGQSWRELHRFEGDGALRYPMLRRLDTGEIVLAYSKGTKQGVMAHVFNPAWVAAQ